MRLDALFYVKNGIASSGLSILSNPASGAVPFIRPASTQKRTVAGWISKSAVSAKNIYPKNSLFVSTNGEGSHTYSYVSAFEFVPNSDVSVLIPKVKMTIQEKVFYARCITLNRYKFSYGRKPKGGRLKKIELPDIIPSWVNQTSIVDNDELSLPVSPELITGSIFSGLDYKLVELSKVFNVAYGHSLELNRLSVNAKGINFVSRTAKNNGISARIDALPEIKPAEAGQITVALGGSVLETFVQTEPFYTGFHVSILTPKVEMTYAQKLFYSVCIRANQYRYNYGRQANRTLKTLLIPEPTTDLLAAIDRYMNAMPYSSQIAFPGDDFER